jgi:hypothetical protein
MVNHYITSVLFDRACGGWVGHCRCGHTTAPWTKERAQMYAAAHTIEQVRAAR